MKNDLKIASFISIICFIGGLFLVPYQLDAMKVMLPEQFEIAMESVTLPFPVLIFVSAIQLTIVSFIVALIGMKLARKTGFSMPILEALFKREKINVDKHGIVLAILFGIITALVLAGADRFYYQYKVEIIGQSEPKFSLIGLLAGVFYGGVFEELLMRLFVMSLIIWVIMKVFRKKHSTLNGISYWIAIMIAAALFALGHLPTTEILFGELNDTLIIRSFLLNGIGGIFFGYMYWKKGFEYAVLSHMFAHISLQCIFIPLLY
nr:CPBP family intramembrane glutamic endopeptidase [Lysinibacillus timonensis]